MGMTQSLRKALLSCPCYTQRCLLFSRVALITQRISLRSVYRLEFIFFYNLGKFQEPDLRFQLYQKPTVQHLCTSVQLERLCWEGSPHDVLLKKLEIALKNYQVDEAWDAYKDFKSLYGFPGHSVMNKLMIILSYTSEPKWLKRVCDLVVLIQIEKPDLLQLDLLRKLALSLARAQMPIPASIIIRLMLDKQSLPPVGILATVILHMVKTEIGTYLASNILVEICDFCQRVTASKSPSANMIKPDTMIFNLVLDACVRFGSSFKGHQIMELMSQVGVVADAHTIVIIARIHEMNGQREELNKFKNHIVHVPMSLVPHYQQFYESLLGLHFKFDDIDAASALILDIYKCWESLPFKQDKMKLQKPCIVSIGSHNLRTGWKLQILPLQMQKDPVLKVESKQELVMLKNGKLVLSNKALAKLIIRYKKCGRIKEFSELLSNIQNKLGSLGEASLCSDVVGACIHLGWLENAHDILEDLELAGTPLAFGSYSSLLTAYYRVKMFKEAEVLLKQIRKVGFLMKMSDEVVVSTHLSEVEDDHNSYSKAATTIGKSDLAESVIREMREEEKVVPSMVYELNSSIFFFTKAKMIGDALKTYRRMQEMNVQPTVSTFFTLINVYSSLEMYREITILWGDIKRYTQKGNLLVNRDLYEFLLRNFLRGGYFERVLEVIGYMKEHGMFLDKSMYKIEFLKFHKDLYRSLKASNAKDETQSKRVEHVQAFRKWVGID
ncbi:unnamed protein product [Ilex paraguariensis]|uniref:At1g68980-like TPR repeats domain-containing protein n=1 Tax=Ilex paraguariensis TaxID=185542 RepID=A0ABC8QMK0_9AQUA